MTQKITVREVGLRDGLQSIPTIVSTTHKLEWISAAHAAGQRETEVGSFVPARLLPQLADTAELVAHAKTLPGLVASVLVPNLKGAERAIELNVDSVLIPLSASAAHSAANVRKTPDEMIAQIAAIRAARDAAGAKTIIEIGLSTAFGCTLQGDVPEDEEIGLLHAALDAGAERMGYKTGIDLAALLALRKRVASWLGGEQLGGSIWRAGVPKSSGYCLSGSTAISAAA